MHTVLLAVMALLSLGQGMPRPCFASPCVACPEFVSRNASDKCNIVWAKAVAGAYATGGMPNQWPSAGDLFGKQMDTTFDRFSDEMPSGRTRKIHGHGSLARVTFATLPGAATLGLTGIYRAGSQHGVIRLSLAGAPSATSYSPGFALKFFVNGVPSANIIGMYGLDGQKTSSSSPPSPSPSPADANFFRNPLKTSVAMPQSSFFADLGFKLFEQGASPSTRLMPDQPALHDSLGVVQTQPVFPDLLYLVPNPDLTTIWENSGSGAGEDFRDKLQTYVPSGTQLYTVVSAPGCFCNGAPCPDPMASCEGQAVPIGTITTTSSFVSSPYVDNVLFFQHSRFVKKPRSTCLYAQALDDGGFDSTTTSSNPKANCSARPVSCPVTGLFVSSTAGCGPPEEDLYLVGAGTGSNVVGIAVGVSVSLVVLLVGLGVAYYIRRKRGSGSGNLRQLEPDAEGGGKVSVPQTQTSATNNYDVNAVVKLLSDFYLRYDPGKSQEEICKIALHFQNNGGMEALNRKLIHKYGRGI